MPADAWTLNICFYNLCFVYLDLHGNKIYVLVVILLYIILML